MGFPSRRMSLYIPVRLIIRLCGISVIVCISPFYPAEELLETIGEIGSRLTGSKCRHTSVTSATSGAHTQMWGGIGFEMYSKRIVSKFRNRIARDIVNISFIIMTSMTKLHYDS